MHELDEFKTWFTKTMMNADGDFDHLPDWLTADMRRAWDAGRASSTSAGVTEEQTPRVTEDSDDRCTCGALCQDIGGGRCRYENASGSKDAPVAWMFQLATNIDGQGNYSGWGRMQLSFTMPAVPVRSIRNLTALEASRAPVSQKEAEPVAWRSRGPKGGWIYRDEKPTGWPSEPVYAAPTPAVEPVGIKALQAKLDAANHVIEQLHGPLSIAALTARADTALAALETAVEALKHSKPVMDRRVHSRLADRIYRRSSPAREDRADG